MKTKLRRLLSILSAMVLMVCCAVPAFAFSNSDLPVGNYNSNDDFSYKEIISQLITKYPDYFKNYVFMIPQSDSSFLNMVSIGSTVMKAKILKLLKMALNTL